MADLTITAANVATGSGAGLNRENLAGETITAGMSVYLKASTGRWMKAQCDGTAEEAGVSVKVGVALHGSLAGQPLTVQVGGQITIGATVTVGTIYVVSSTLGGIAPMADLASTNRLTIVGIGISSSLIDMSLIPIGNTGITMP